MTFQFCDFQMQTHVFYQHGSFVVMISVAGVEDCVKYTDEPVIIDLLLTHIFAKCVLSI